MKNLREHGEGVMRHKKSAWFPEELMQEIPTA